MAIPSVHMLAHHDAIDSYVPHLGGTMSTGFQLVVNLFSFVGAFDGSAAFVDHFPLI